MRAGNLPQDVSARLAGHASLIFGSRQEWMDHLRALGLTDLRVAPDPVRVASEAALWGAIEAEGLLGGAVIVSDDAGQFRIGEHALCWVHAERLIHKLVPANDKQSNVVKVAKRMIGWLYRRLKAYKRAPNKRASCARNSIASSGAAPVMRRSIVCSSVCSRARMNFCACSKDRKSRSTPTRRPS